MILVSLLHPFFWGFHPLIPLFWFLKMDIHVYAFFSHSGLHGASGHHSVCAFLGYMYLIMYLHHLAGFLGIISLGLRGFSYLTLTGEWASFITLLAGRESQPRQAALCWEAPGSVRNLHNLLHVALPCLISLYVCCWILLPLLPDPQILQLSTNCGNCIPLKLFRVMVLHGLCTHCYHSYLQGNGAFCAHGTHFSRVHVSTIISFRPKIHFIHGLRWTQQIGRFPMHGFS